MVRKLLDVLSSMFYLIILGGTEEFSKNEQRKDRPMDIKEAISDLKKNVGTCHREEVSRLSSIHFNPPSSNLHHFVKPAIHRHEACYFPSSSQLVSCKPRGKKYD